MTDNINWYADAYLSDPGTDNPFGQEARREPRNAELHVYLASGGKLSEYPRKPGADVIPLIDAALSRTRGLL